MPFYVMGLVAKLGLNIYRGMVRVISKADVVGSLIFVILPGKEFS